MLEVRQGARPRRGPACGLKLPWYQRSSLCCCQQQAVVLSVRTLGRWLAKGTQLSGRQLTACLAEWGTRQLVHLLGMLPYMKRM